MGNSRVMDNNMVKRNGPGIGSNPSNKRLAGNSGSPGNKRRTDSKDNKRQERHPANNLRTNNLRTTNQDNQVNRRQTDSG